MCVCVCVCACVCVFVFPLITLCFAKVFPVDRI